MGSAPLTIDYRTRRVYRTTKLQALSVVTGAILLPCCYVAMLVVQVLHIVITWDALPHSALAEATAYGIFVAMIGIPAALGTLFSVLTIARSGSDEMSPRMTAAFAISTAITILSIALVLTALYKMIQQLFLLL